MDEMAMDAWTEHEADDLLSLFTFIDEQKVFDQLPKYVSGTLVHLITSSTI